MKIVYAQLSVGASRRLMILSYSRPAISTAPRRGKIIKAIGVMQASEPEGMAH